MDSHDWGRVSVMGRGLSQREPGVSLQKRNPGLTKALGLKELHVAN